MAFAVKCTFCGADLIKKTKRKTGNYFCNIECRGNWMKTLKPWNFKGKVATTCDICGKEFFRLESKTKPNKYCSRDCYMEAKRRQTGELHPLYERTDITCEICGNVVGKNSSRFNRANHHFCSIECKRQWNDKIDYPCDWCRKIIKMTKSYRDKNPTHFCSKQCLKNAGRVRTLKLLKTYPRETLPEKITREYFLSKKICFEQYANISNKYNVDFLLPCEHTFKGIVVEVLGDYFHCHPQKFPEPISFVQKKSVARDAQRYAYLSKCGYLVFGIWECDIKSDVESALKPVTDYIRYGIISATSHFEHLREVNSNE
jgi:G:T-mismatch repair DNA endonuclease (very short patch repair protein)